MATLTKHLFFPFTLQFIIIEFYVYKLVLNSLKTVEENFEMLVGSRNTSEIFLASVAQQLKEYIGVTEGKHVTNHNSQSNLIILLQWFNNYTCIGHKNNIVGCFCATFLM